MSIFEEVLKALQSVVTPELKAMQERLDGNHREMGLRFDAMQERMDLRFGEVYLRFDAMNQRFDDLLQRLALERRLAVVEQELDEKRQAS